MVDENGAAVILKNNTPRYVIIDYSKLQEDKIADNVMVEEAATKYYLIWHYMHPFKRLKVQSYIHRYRAKQLDYVSV